MVDNLKAHITAGLLRLHRLTSNNTNNNNILNNNSMRTKTKINRPAITREVVTGTDEIVNKPNLSFF